MADYGITGYGAYIPKLRLDRKAIAGAHRWMAPSLAATARGARAFCSWDEDAITMAVEAARDCVAPHSRQGLARLTFVSTTAPYADLQNSVIVAGALRLPPATRVADVGGSQRAGVSALAASLRGGGDGELVVAADRLRAKPASVQEMVYGAGAAAFTLGREEVIARLLGSAQAMAPFADHFRAAGEAHDYAWEERWVRDEGYAKIIPGVVADCLAEAGCAIADVATLILASPLRGAAASLGKQIGFTGRLADPFDDGCGYAGVAHPLIMLAGALETAEPGQKILLIGFGQGAEALLLETTPACRDKPPSKGVTARLRDSVPTTDYLRMASFYDEIELDWGMRGEKSGKAALTTQYREAGQLSGFVAGRCRACGTVQFPRLAYCVNPQCAAPASQFDDYSLTGEPAEVLTFTADWLSYHPAPPLYVGFVQFAVGARLLMEIVDVGPAGIDVGTKLDIVFRIKERDKQRGFNRYFWKATPTAAAGAEEKR